MNGEEVEIPLPGTRADVGAGRRFVRDTVERWGYPDVAEDAALIASELITNVVLHARTALEVVVRRGHGRIRIEVADKNTELPRIRQHSAQSGTGRGLHLVAAVAADWGVETRRDGKIVWVELTSRVESVTRRGRRKRARDRPRRPRGGRWLGRRAPRSLRARLAA